MRDARWRRRRLADARLYLCGDRTMGLGSAGGSLRGVLDAVLSGGVDIVQLRDKGATDEEVCRAAETFRAAAHRHSALFILNDRPELAAQVDADGVHVGQDDPSPEAARTAVGADRLVGRSTHSVEQVDKALAEDCDYFAIGPVHPTPTKQGRPGIGLDPVRHAAAVAERPWFVTGGMSLDSAGEVLAAGAMRIVVVRAITESDDPAATAKRLAALLAPA